MKLELELPLKEEADGLAEKKQKHLELRLGISSSDGIEGGGELTRFMGHQDVGLAQQRAVSIGLGHGGSKRCFSQTGSGFLHPWSLAARQQKAALEQTQRSPSSSSHIPRFGFSLSPCESIRYSGLLCKYRVSVWLRFCFYTRKTQVLHLKLLLLLYQNIV